MASLMDSLVTHGWWLWWRSYHEVHWLNRNGAYINFIELYLAAHICRNLSLLWRYVTSKRYCVSRFFESLNIFCTLWGMNALFWWRLIDVVEKWKWKRSKKNWWRSTKFFVSVFARYRWTLKDDSRPILRQIKISWTFSATLLNAIICLCWVRRNLYIRTYLMSTTRWFE